MSDYYLNLGYTINREGDDFYANWKTINEKT